MRESGEMYLESILALSQKQEHVRSVDVSRYLDYSKPSVSVALRNLKNDGYISFDVNGYITLTEKGTDTAAKVYERHLVLTKLLTAMGISEETAEKDACRIEHVISDETFAKLSETERGLLSLAREASAQKDAE